MTTKPNTAPRSQQRCYRSWHGWDSQVRNDDDRFWRPNLSHRAVLADLIAARLIPHMLNQTLIDAMRELLLRIQESSIENVLFRILQQINSHIKLEGLFEAIEQH